MNDDQTQAVTHGAVSRALETLFIDGDEEAAFEQVSASAAHRHLKVCDACRQRFDGLALADRFLCGDALPGAQREAAASGPADFERAFGRASFEAALDEMLAAEEDNADIPGDEAPKPETTGGADVVELGSPSAQSPPTFGRFAAAAAVVLVAAASWFWFAPGGPEIGQGGDSEFAPRSASSPTEQGAAMFEQPEVAVFCAERYGDGVDFTGADEAPFGLVSCPIDAELKLAYRNESSRLQYAAFFGVDQQGRIYWYGPTPTDAEAMRVQTSSKLEPVGESIRLQVNHRPGSVRVVGLFTTEPIDFEELEYLVDSFDTEALFEGKLPDQLTVPGTFTTSSFEVIDGGSQ